MLDAGIGNAGATAALPALADKGVGSPDELRDKWHLARNCKPAWSEHATLILGSARARLPELLRASLWWLWLWAARHSQGRGRAFGRTAITPGVQAATAS